MLRSWYWHFPYGFRDIRLVILTKDYMLVRKETEADIDAIIGITKAALKTLPISNNTEIIQSTTQ